MSKNTVYSKLASDDVVVVATNSADTAADRRPGLPGCGVVFLACAVMLSLMTGGYFMQNLYFSTGKDVFLEFGSGSNAMLLGPFAGSGLTAIAEEIEVIEYEMEIQEEEEGTTTNPTTMTTTSTATSSTATASVSASSKEAPVVAASTTTSSGALEMGGEANAEGDPIVDTPSTATSSKATASVSVLAGDPKAPDTFLVTLRTTVVGENGVSEAGNSIVIKVIRAWAPLGADHFHALVMDDFYTEAAFFRVVPNFVVQFGIAGTCCRQYIGPNCEKYSRANVQT